ncbi:MAG: M81 family metallopeptidase [Saprospiraceae bacterium]|nr:M81 family metallopeptidase [Saprospiraceae bacterium]
MLTNKKQWRIGIIGIYHESNTFIDQRTSMANFAEGHLFFGDAILAEYEKAFHEIGGMVEVLRQHPVDIVPIMYAEATPGGIIDLPTAEQLMHKLRVAVQETEILDGLLVSPHGAAVSENSDDFDGMWLTMIRELLPDIPIIGTLDPHANVSEKMVEVTDALIAYKTNPHIDQRAVGKQAAVLMIDTLAEKIKPVQRLLSSNVAISIEQQYTAASPCLELYHLAEELSRKAGVLSVSINLGFPYADVPDMASSFIVVTDNDEPLADKILKELQDYFVKNHRDFSGKKTSVGEAMEKIEGLDKPVLLLDMGDNVGGGSPGDGTFLLHALESKRSWKSFICICDPEVVKQIIERSMWDHISVIVGGKSDDKHGDPLTSMVKLISIVDGKFTESEARHGGQVRYDMGKTAIVETPNGTTIMITSLRTVPFSLQQLLHFKLEPAAFDVIVAKGVQAPIAAYGPVCPSMIRVNTPGVTTADINRLTYEKRKKPLFPFEEINQL